MPKNLLFQRAAELGITALEVYSQTKENTKISVFQQEVDSYKTSKSTGIAVRGLYQGKVGNTFLEEPLHDNIEFVLQKVIENASSISSTDVCEFYPGSVYEPIDLYYPALEETSMEDKIAVLKRLDANLKQLDPRIKTVNYCQYQESTIHVSITNSLGLDVQKKSNHGFVVVGCVASENDDNQSYYDYEVIRDMKNFNEDAFLANIAKEVIAKLNATKVPSNTYQVLLRNDVMSSLLEALSSTFSADLVQKGISIFKDSLGTKIFHESITMIDDPLLVDGYSSTPFDDEGVPTKTKTIIKDGVLTTFFHNLKTAKKAGLETTGNGFKNSYASSVGVSPTNFYIVPGLASYSSLVAGMQEGVIITDVAGIHAGLNAITTEFSLQANGFYVKDGVIVRPINLITVAGKFTTMMKEITAIGSDLKFSPSGIGAPSILFSGLQISGE